MDEIAEPAEPKRKPRKGLFGFARDRKGVTAVEFALVAMPFALLMSALAENGLIFYTQSNLDFAMMETAREIRTGEVHTNSLTKADLQNLICNHMNTIGSLNCSANLYLDVRSFPNFASLTAPTVTSGGTVSNALLKWSPGNASEVVVVRGFYTWKLITPVISAPMANLGTNTRLLTSTALFMNEPW